MDKERTREEAREDARWERRDLVKSNVDRARELLQRAIELEGDLILELSYDGYNGGDGMDSLNDQEGLWHFKQRIDAVQAVLDQLKREVRRSDWGLDDVKPEWENT